MSSSFRVSEGGVALWYGWFEAMHTRMDILLTGIPEKAAEELGGKMERKVREMECRLSCFDRKSDIYRINHTPGAGTLPLDGGLLSVFEQAETYRVRTGGWFDIAVHTPGQTLLGETYRVDRGRGELIRLREGLLFDFGGYAKGLALDKLREMAFEAGVVNGLISFGNSSVCCLGHHPQGKAWSVGVENPAIRGRTLTFFELRDASLSSSGNNGTNDGHILSAGDGQPVRDPVIVSVGGRSPLDCEVLSTALLSSRGKARPETVLCGFDLLRVTEMEYRDGVSVLEIFP